MDREIETEVEYLRRILPRVFAEGVPFVITMMQSLIRGAEERGLGLELEHGFSNAEYKVFLDAHCSRLIMTMEDIPSNEGSLALWTIASLSRKPNVGGSLDWHSGHATLTGFREKLRIPVTPGLCHFALELGFTLRDGEMVQTD
ncbi:MAG: hypothetical protein CEN92_38 [Candidatus Berkelbacteria bacterium Licking1014_96]|uniref:Uncharacterized protein n=1 Tax=Candidatus Berkelbacteria bacterium Licking1014_96 TaxID=2017149 RepID=A0A554LHB2_9BACT|nr:MAG: hypothetical protein CEN92_38 [Candidatus Berkelbacteria bacterium Licking1014_96]